MVPRWSRTTLCLLWWRVLYSTSGDAANNVISYYPKATEQAKRRMAYDFNLLPAPQGGRTRVELAGFVPSGAVLLLGPVPPDPLTKLVLHNVGYVRLRFSLSPDPTKPEGDGTEVQPGATLSCTLADLGDPVKAPNLLVFNPTSELGQYEVTVG